MVAIALPFSIDNITGNKKSEVSNTDFLDTLPTEFKQVAEENPFLLEYLRILPISRIGVPTYCQTLSKKMDEIKEPNIIYPVRKNIFAHILADTKDGRHFYITIEPSLTMNLTKLIRDIETTCIEHGEELPEFNTDGDKEKQLIGYIDMVTNCKERNKTDVVNDLKANKDLNSILKFFRKDKNKLTRVNLNKHELDGVKYLFLRDKIGIGTLEPLVADPNIEDISCSGLGHIFVEHKVFRSLKSPFSFNVMDDLDHFVMRLAEQIRKPVSYREPIADASLPSGARINIVYGGDVSKRGSNFTIRQFSEVPASIFELVNWKTINYQMLAYLAMVIGNGMNLFVAGETASGKTTMLNALTTFIPPLAKVVTIEDTPELQVPHQNWIREVVQTNKNDDKNSSVTIFELLKAALRQRPNAILIGEIRGAEGSIAFQAMQTGHPVMATFHAATTEKLIQRLTSNPIFVPRAYIDNLNVAVLMSSVKLPNGKFARRITAIDEIVGYDSVTESFNIVQAFVWDEVTDTYQFTGYTTSFILEQKIAPRVGIPSNKKMKIYIEIDRRAKILEKLHKDQGITGFYEILNVLSQAQRQGLF
ncbi:MAG: type II/IV secretion system ATPase subunit [Chloroflexi bacterium]|nr:type II/IV secretion system ATPase subunit [Chloroflexota bacterium]